MTGLNLGVPTIEEATLILNEGSKLNPGPWIEHSLFVGKAAELIANEDKELDGNIALVLGMLHDIGRQYGVTSMRHSIDGYNLSMKKGYALLARICITHSFSYKNIDAVFGKWDCSDKEYKFVKEYLDKIDFTAYDKLIQLCDALALPTGYCLMEKRMLDVAMRHGVNEYTIKKWETTFENKSFFEERIGKSIYSVLPNVVENTFKF
ncbi:HD domain-containing protein [Clostridium bowmanii]|uniref:HD domain-containing protein n=1 Tax=Clostridium bowmanii TaxID=132925 RepID=UPI001C0D551A|nr:HD domain-containing protein [Clostridium bowmanii]MBU3191842.1 HD domain-containing protein [Clostridium bowmanii]MCA1076168.1 HD domain-containing protein [Clostridium bowmanii]